MDPESSVVDKFGTSVNLHPSWRPATKPSRLNRAHTPVDSHREEDELVEEPDRAYKPDAREANARESLAQKFGPRHPGAQKPAVHQPVAQDPTASDSRSSWRWNFFSLFRKKKATAEDASVSMVTTWKPQNAYRDHLQSVPPSPAYHPNRHSVISASSRSGKALRPQWSAIDQAARHTNLSPRRQSYSSQQTPPSRTPSPYSYTFKPGAAVGSSKRHTLSGLPNTTGPQAAGEDRVNLNVSLQDIERLRQAGLGVPASYQDVRPSGFMFNGPGSSPRSSGPARGHTVWYSMADRYDALAAQQRTPVNLKKGKEPVYGHRDGWHMLRSESAGPSKCKSILLRRRNTSNV
jgi:hypothetical protein